MGLVWCNIKALLVLLLNQFLCSYIFFNILVQNSSRLENIKGSQCSVCETVMGKMLQSLVSSPVTWKGNSIDIGQWSVPKAPFRNCESSTGVHVHLLIKDQAFNLSIQALLTMLSISEIATQVYFTTMTVSSNQICVPYPFGSTLSTSHVILRKRRRALLSESLEVLNYCRI